MYFVFSVYIVGDVDACGWRIFQLLMFLNLNFPSDVSSFFLPSV